MAPRDEVSDGRLERLGLRLGLRAWGLHERDREPGCRGGEDDRRNGVESLEANEQASAVSDPSAISGPSGPSTAPKPSVPTAANATPGPYRSGVGSALIPSSGGCPPSPGSSLRAVSTIAAPATGSPTTRYKGGEVSPRWDGRSVHIQCSRSWTNPRNSAATTAAGMPIKAANPTSRRESARLGAAVRAPPARSPAASELIAERLRRPHFAGRLSSAHD